MSKIFDNVIDYFIKKTISFSEKMEKIIGNENASIIYMLAAVFIFFIISIFSKLHINEINALQTQAFRGTSMMLASHYIMKKVDIDIIIPDRKLQNRSILRNILAAQYSICFFFMISKIPLSELMILHMIGIFIIGFLDFLINKTIYTKNELTLSLISFIGAILIIKPEIFITDYEPPQYSKNYAPEAEKIFCIFIYMLSAGLWAYSVVVIKELQGLCPLTVSYPFGICMAIMSSVGQIFYENCQQYTVYLVIKMLLFLGVFSTVQSICSIRANQLGKPGKIGILSNLSVVFSFLFEILYLNEIPTTVAIVGTILVILSSIKLTLEKNK